MYNLIKDYDFPEILKVPSVKQKRIKRYCKMLITPCNYANFN